MWSAAAKASERAADGVRLESAAAQAFRSLSRWLAAEVERPDSHLLRSRSLAENVEQTLLGLLLDCLDDCRPPYRPRSVDAAEACVRRIEAWMELQVGEPVGIEDFAVHAGVSVRTVQLAFRRRRGCTPTQAFIRLRLDRARQLLLAASPLTTVTGVASDCGFYQFDRFAARYRRLFGESPSATLDRGRRQAAGAEAAVAPLPEC